MITLVHIFNKLVMLILLLYPFPGLQYKTHEFKNITLSYENQVSAIEKIADMPYTHKTFSHKFGLSQTACCGQDPNYRSFNIVSDVLIYVLYHNARLIIKHYTMSNHQRNASSNFKF